MVLVQLAVSLQHTVAQNTLSSSYRQECTLLFHAMPARSQSSLSIKFTTLFAIPHAINTSVPNTVQTPESLTSLLTVTLWIAKIISSYLPLLPTFIISKHSLLNIPTKHVSKTDSTQPKFSENTDNTQ